MRAPLEDWLPPGHRGDPLTDQMSVALVYHGAGREAGLPCGVFRLDGAMLGCVEYGRLLGPSGQLLAVSRQLLGGDRLWRTDRRRRFSLLATGDEVIAIGLRHTPSARRGERIAMIMLSEVVTTSQQWAAILDSCQALGLPAPVANE